MKSLKKILKAPLLIIFVALVVNVFWQVLSRYFFKSPTAFTEELARYLLIWLIVLGSVYVHISDEHLKLDLFKETTYKKIVVHLLSLLFSLLVLVLGGFWLMYTTYTLMQYSAVLQIPLAFVYSVLPLSGILMAVHSLFSIFRHK